MKKLLAFFSAFVVTSSGVGSVVSCGDGTTDGNNNNNNNNNNDTSDSLTFEEAITSFNKVGTTEWDTENADEISEIAKDMTKMWDWTKKYFVNPFLKILELDINNDLQSLEKVKQSEVYLKFYKSEALHSTLGYLEITEEDAEELEWPFTKEQIKEYNTIYEEKNCEVYFQIKKIITRG